MLSMAFTGADALMIHTFLKKQSTPTTKTEYESSITSTISSTRTERQTILSRLRKAIRASINKFKGPKDLAALISSLPLPGLCKSVKAVSSEPEPEIDYLPFKGIEEYPSRIVETVDVSRDTTQTTTPRKASTLDANLDNTPSWLGDFLYT